jgi:surfactin synthase thioesterase subunit
VHSPWFPYAAAAAESRLRLFCLPYAGGNSALFGHWQDALDPGSGIQVVPVKLPGRLERLAEPAVDRMDRLADLLAAQLAPLLDRPYALFGVSMGALLAFETAHRLLAADRPAPARLFPASYRAPRERFETPSVHRLPDPELLQVLGRLAAVPPELLAYEELMRMMLPTVRADFACTETYRYRERGPLPVPVTAVRGLGDPTLTSGLMAGWAEETSAGFELVEVDGDHFLVNGGVPGEQQGPLLKLIRDRLPRG